MRDTGAGRSATVGWLVHPVTVGALVVLVVNDHLLKARFPGAVTGKASDVAGLLLAPAVLAVVATLLVPRLPVRFAALAAVVVTGLGFVAAKATAAGAGAVSALWSVVAGSSVIRADPTDLWALPALGLALSVALSITGPAGPADQPDQPDLPDLPDLPGPATDRRGRWRRLAVFVVLPAAVLAIAATSAAPSKPYIAFVATSQSTLIGSPTDVPPGADHIMVSDDAGRTWREATVTERAGFPLSERSGVPFLAQVAPRTSACVDALPRVCYRIQPGRSRVEETTDAGATWRVAWELPAWQQQALAEAHEQNDVGQVAPMSLAVQGRPNQGHVVVVACGFDGLLVRDLDGNWRRIGFGSRVTATGVLDAEPPVPLPQASLTVRASDLPLAILAGVFVFLVAGLVALATRRRLDGGWLVLTGVLLPLAVLGGGIGAANDAHTGFLEAAIAGLSAWVGVVFGLGAVIPLFIVAFLGCRRWPVGVTGLVVTLGAGTLLIWGSSGYLDRRPAWALAGGLTLVGCAVAAGLARRSARSAVEDTPRYLPWPPVPVVSPAPVPGSTVEPSVSVVDQLDG